MNIILSVLLPILDSLAAKVQNDAGGPALAVVGIVVLVCAAIGVVGLIVAAVIILKWLNKNKKKEG
jgi:hypothetical protein